MHSAREFSETLTSTTGLTSLPVGVRFLHTTVDLDPNAGSDYRMCQAIMEARRGKSVVIQKDNISCPAAAAALGLKPLTKQLQDGTMLCGYGIFKTRDAAIRVMETMPRLNP